ncbi:putative F-box/LRR-repeat protein 23 [Salvia hispanica]|uniref:putative F-box/LRR-repeat protein 23 n=1 Tax=Salvia hispanica TaxID=49212 RepID=UPI00200908DB|nr:putative F-box/LRR-repeat protein 23 [Salvia hispanica]
MLSEGAKSESSELMIQTKLPIPTMAASPSSSAAPPLPLSPPWIELPDDLTVNILQRLDAKEIIMSAQLVCSTWWRVCKNPAMWRVIHLHCAGDKFEFICLRAVDRSQGQLLELKLSGFEVDGGWLHYVADRSSQLRCLTVDVFRRIESSVLTVAIKKLTQLEELHLSLMDPSLSPDDFESIGISCPMLKSFAYNGGQWEFTEYVVAIGKNMPNLRHLRLFSYCIGNQGLEAILDGCPNLELLHLQRCSGLDLQGGLGKRCSDRIKDLILDSEPSQSECDQVDYDWYNDNESTASDSDHSGYAYVPDFI